MIKCLSAIPYTLRKQSILLHSSRLFAFKFLLLWCCPTLNSHLCYTDTHLYIYIYIYIYNVFIFSLLSLTQFYMVYCPDEGSYSICISISFRATGWFRGLCFLHYISIIREGFVLWLGSDVCSYHLSFLIMWIFFLGKICFIYLFNVLVRYQNRVELT